MVSQDTTQKGLLDLIAELRSRQKEREQELDEIKQNIAAVQRALELLRERYGLPPTEPKARGKLEALRGLTLPQALMEYARTHGGMVKVSEARRDFIEAGIIGNPKTAYQRLTSVLIRSDLFERSSPGEYRFLEYREKLRELTEN